MHHAPATSTGRARKHERLPLNLLEPLEQASVPSNRRPTTLEHLAAARRTELANQWSVAAQVEQALSDERSGQAPSAMRWLREGRLLAAYLPDSGGSWHFPPWQFGSDGKPVQYLTEILGSIRSTGQFLDAKGRTTGWAEIEWFLSGHALLNGRSPAELLSTMPYQVLRAALAEFQSEN